MDKIPTLFLRNPENMKFVLPVVNPDAAWVLEGHGTATVKKDGTPVLVHVVNGRLMLPVHKRRNPTREEKAQGAEPGWIEMNRADTADKHLFAAIDATNFAAWPDGEWACEALGPKIQGGVESDAPCLYAFSLHPHQLLFEMTPPRTFEGLREYLAVHAIEGIVWHDHVHHRLAKIKRRDFGLPWPVKEVTSG